MEPFSIIAAVGGLLKPLVAPITQHFKAKQDIKAAKVAAEIAVIQAKTEHVQHLASRDQDAEIDWNLAQIKNSGWKDEYLLLLFSIPLVMCFIPGCDLYVTAGFTALKETPDWYQWSITIMVAAAYGYQKFANHFIKK